MQVSNFTEFLEKNRDRIIAVANSNTIRDKDGSAVLAKDDPWRQEHEWDKHYQDCLKKQKP